MVAKVVISSVESGSCCYQRTRHCMKNHVICTDVTKRANPYALFRSPIVSLSIGWILQVFFLNQICKLFTINRKQRETWTMEYESTHICEECVTHRPVWITESSEFLNALVGRFPLFYGHARYNFWKENRKELLAKLKPQRLPSGSGILRHSTDQLHKNIVVMQLKSMLSVPRPLG